MSADFSGPQHLRRTPVVVGWPCLNHGEVAQILNHLYETRELPRRFNREEPACQFRRHRRCWLSPWVRKIAWRRAWQPTLVFLPGESHGQRSLVRYSPWSHNRSDTTEATWHAHTHGTGKNTSNIIHVCTHARKLLPSCPTLCDPTDCSPPGSSVHGILQARTLEWVARSSSIQAILKQTYSFGNFMKNVYFHIEDVQLQSLPWNTSPVASLSLQTWKFPAESNNQKSD